VRAARRGALSDFAVTSNDAADPLKFLHMTVDHLNHIIELAFTSLCAVMSAPVHFPVDYKPAPDV
jgi:hypothetical protein